jgi:hypothetical protein
MHDCRFSSGKESNLSIGFKLAFSHLGPLNCIVVKSSDARSIEASSIANGAQCTNST